VRYRSAQAVYIDDYAHHPTEIRAALSAARQLYPNKRMTVVFQPHLFTRTRDFLDEFALSLQTADEVFLLPIYPARELPLPGITSEALAAAFPEGQQPRVLSPEEVIDWTRQNQPELLLTLGAGDIDRLVAPLEDLFSHGFQPLNSPSAP
jgi:UDP-N-acetylmuramate--alanine ligase